MCREHAENELQGLWIIVVIITIIIIIILFS